MLSPQDAATLPDGSADLVVMHSVAQYLTKDEAARLFVLFRRLVAKDVETVFQRHPGRWKVHMVGRDDGDEIHPRRFGQPGLALDHLLERAVATVGGQEKVRATGLRAFRVGGERAADQFNLLIHRRRDAVHGADERAAPAADHAVMNFSAHNV